MGAVSEAVSGPLRKTVNIPGLISDYYTLAPDPDDRAQLVAFGTSGHRGSSSRKSFNEAHILRRTLQKHICSADTRTSQRFRES